MTYEQVTGKWLGPDGDLWGIGYSGKGVDKNNPASEGKLAEGPIPTGNYRIEGPPINTIDHGPYVLNLVPDDVTRTRILSLGRDPDSFRLHGDSIPHPGNASEGCIIMSRDIREKVWQANSVDPWLSVEATILAPDTNGEIAT